MAHKTKSAAKVLPSIKDELIDRFIKGPMTAEAVQDAAMAFKKALIERALGAELGHHLGYAAGADRPPAFISTVTDAVMEEIGNLAGPPARALVSGHFL